MRRSPTQISATNVGGLAATDVELGGVVEDWFNWRATSCGSGTAIENGPATCGYGSVAPGESVSMTLTMQACCPERDMSQFAWVQSTDDVNPSNDTVATKLVFTGPKHRLVSTR